MAAYDLLMHPAFRSVIERVCGFFLIGGSTLEKLRVSQDQFPFARSDAESYLGYSGAAIGNPRRGNHARKFKVVRGNALSLSL